MPTAEPRISLVLPAKNQVLKGQATASAEAWRRDRVCLSGSVLCSGCIVQTNASSSLLQPGLVGGSKAPLRLDQTDRGRPGRKAKGRWKRVEGGEKEERASGWKGEERRGGDG